MFGRLFYFINLRKRLMLKKLTGATRPDSPELCTGGVQLSQTRIKALVMFEL